MLEIKSIRRINIPRNKFDNMLKFSSGLVTKIVVILCC